MKTKDPDARAVAKACKALEESSSAPMLVANLRFLWDRYVAHPPPNAWWQDPRATRPGVRP